MGTVYSAMDAVLEERVALKLMRSSLAEDPEAVARFHWEVRLARRVTHRNVARTFDIGEDAGRPFLTMELVEGESLHARLRAQGALPLVTVVALGRQVCEALAAAHDSGVIHRDLKPANILVEPEGRAVVTDFGIAHRSHLGGTAPRTDSVVLGTPDYMAPEQRAGSAPTPKTDLFALGVTLYEMATGHRPSTADAPTPLASESLSTEHALPPTLRDVIHWCTHHDPEQRPTSARVVGSALDRAARQGRTRGTTTGHDQAPARDFAPVDPGHQALAVLPLRYHGPPQDAYLAEAMTEHLVDLLSMTQGLRMSGLGATAHFAEQRDPRGIGRALGVDTVIDGTLHRAGPRLRVTIRVLETQGGRQTWCETFDGELRDVFELQDHIATQIAEALRLRLERASYEFTAPAEAVELFLRARLHLTTLGDRAEYLAAADALERCLALAPGFPSALASLALTYAGLRFVYSPVDDERDWPSLCETAVAEALRDAPDLPETHLAAARMQGQQGDFLGAARALARALELAPTHAATHAMLGTLQCEAGLTDEGRRHIELAIELDPRDLSPLFGLARHHGLHGDYEQFEATVERLCAWAPRMQPIIAVLRMRVAIWRGDRPQIRRWHDVIRHSHSSQLQFVEDLGRYVLGELELPAVQAAFEARFPATVSRRRRAVNDQVLVEALMARGEHALGMEHLHDLAMTMLVDIDWLERCPLLEPLRGKPPMATIESTVRARAQAIWSIA